MTNKTDNDELNGKKSINPIVAVSVAIIIAIIISLINLVLFMKSDMYEKVKLIQNPRVLKVDTENIDTTSILKKDDLELIKNDIDSRFELLRDENDYSIYDVSEVSLGI